MVDDDPPDYLDDKDEGTRRRITRRVGERLSIENLPDAERLAGEALARELVSDAIEHVRAEFANAVRHARYLPQDIALKIAHDVDSVAGPFLEVTEVFSEAEWQRLVRTISLTSRVTVARRASLTEGVVIALAEIGDAVVVEALIENPDAPLTEQVCYLIVDRFADQTAVLDQLAQRDSLGAEIALDLVAKVSATVRAMLTKKYNLGGGGKRLADETEIASILALVRKAPKVNLLAVVRSVHNSGRLTPDVVLRALREDLLAFFEVAVAYLAESLPGEGEEILLPEDEDPAIQLFGAAGIPEVMHKDMWDALEEARANAQWNNSYQS